MTFRRMVCLLSLAAAAIPAACKKGQTATDSAKAVAQSGAGSTAAVDSSATGPQTALPVSVELVRDGDLVLSVITTGLVRSQAEAKLRFESPGTVDRVFVRPGQHVKKGDVLAVLDTIPFALALRRAEQAVEQSELSYQDMLVDSVVSGRRPTEERRKNALIRSGLANAKLGLEQARLDRARAVLRAPYNGVIDKVEATEGERTDQGESSITLVDIDNLRIEAAVLEHYMPLIKEGGDAVISSSAAPNQIVHGRIMNVLPIVDSVSRAGRAYIVLPGNGVLRPGMSVDVRLEARRLLKRRLVPTKAIIMRDERPLVFVVRDGRAEWVYIRPGFDNGFDTEVLADTVTQEIPVKSGDQVVVRGHLTLTHQALVRVVKKEEGAEIKR